MKEKMLCYLGMETFNYALLPYELLIGFSFEQSIICRLFASITDLIVLLFFLNTKFLWNAKKENKTFKDHLMAGVKLLVQIPPIYILKIIFVNSVAIPKIQELGFTVEKISWSNVGLNLSIAFVFWLMAGILYSMYRKNIASFVDYLKNKIFFLSKKAKY